MATENVHSVDLDGVSLTQDKTDPKVHKEVFSVSDAVVRQTRQDTPLAENGTPIQRLPFSPKLAALVASGVTVKRIASQDRCLHVVEIPLKGGNVGKFHCSLPCVAAGTDGEKYCPEHDREVFRPNQTDPPRNQRTFCSADIELTESEREVRNEKNELVGRLEVGRTSRAIISSPETTKASDFVPQVLTERVKRQYTRRETARPRAARRQPGGVVVRFDVHELGTPGMVDILRTRLIAALDALPASSIAQMKDVVRIQEFIEKELRYQEEGK